MKQPNLAEKIITMSIEGIQIGISSAIRTFIDLILRVLFGTSAFAECGQSNTVSLPLPDTMKIKIRKSRGGVERAVFDNDKCVHHAVTSESESTPPILASCGKSCFAEHKSSPLFAGLLPHDISILCRYWCSNKFDCVIVL